MPAPSTSDISLSDNDVISANAVIDQASWVIGNDFVANGNACTVGTPPSTVASYTPVTYNYNQVFSYDFVNGPNSPTPTTFFINRQGKAIYKSSSSDINNPKLVLAVKEIIKP